MGEEVSAEKRARLQRVLDIFNCVAPSREPYVPHPWTACNYDDEVDCQEQAVFGVQEVGVDKPDGGVQACVAHVGEMLETENWRGSQWRVWTL